MAANNKTQPFNFTWAFEVSMYIKRFGIHTYNSKYHLRKNRKIFTTISLLLGMLLHPAQAVPILRSWGIFLALVFSSMLLLSLLHLCNHVKYIRFDTNLCTRRKVTTAKLPDCFWSFLLLIMLGLLFCEYPDFPLIMFIIFINSSCGSAVNLILRFGKILSRTIFSILSIYIYSIAFTPATCILSLMIFQI